MPVLNTADDIKFGAEQVSAVYYGSEQVWSGSPMLFVDFALCESDPDNYTDPAGYLFAKNFPGDQYYALAYYPDYVTYGGGVQMQSIDAIISPNYDGEMYVNFNGGEYVYGPQKWEFRAKLDSIPPDNTTRAIWGDAGYFYPSLRTYTDPRDGLQHWGFTVYCGSGGDIDYETDYGFPAVPWEYALIFTDAIVDAEEHDYVLDCDDPQNPNVLTIDGIIYPFVGFCGDDGTLREEEWPPVEGMISRAAIAAYTGGDSNPVNASLCEYSNYMYLDYSSDYEDYFDTGGGLMSADDTPVTFGVNIKIFSPGAIPPWDGSGDIGVLPEDFEISDLTWDDYWMGDSGRDLSLGAISEWVGVNGTVLGLNSVSGPPADIGELTPNDRQTVSFSLGSGLRTLENDIGWCADGKGSLYAVVRGVLRNSEDVVYRHIITSSDGGPVALIANGIYDGPTPQFRSLPAGYSGEIASAPDEPVWYVIGVGWDSNDNRKSQWVINDLVVSGSHTSTDPLPVDVFGIGARIGYNSFIMDCAFVGVREGRDPIPDMQAIVDKLCEEFDIVPGLLRGHVTSGIDSSPVEGATVTPRAKPADGQIGGGYYDSVVTDIDGYFELPLGNYITRDSIQVVPPDSSLFITHRSGRPFYVDGSFMSIELTDASWTPLDADSIDGWWAASDTASITGTPLATAIDDKSPSGYDQSKHGPGTSTTDSYTNNGKNVLFNEDGPTPGTAAVGFQAVAAAHPEINERVTFMMVFLPGSSANMYGYSEQRTGFINHIIGPFEQGIHYSPGSHIVPPGQVGLSLNDHFYVCGFDLDLNKVRLFRNGLISAIVNREFTPPTGTDNYLGLLTQYNGDPSGRMFFAEAIRLQDTEPGDGELYRVLDYLNNEWEVY